MKNAQTIPLLLGSILLASSVLAQTANSSPTSSLPEPDPVIVARSPYIQAENDSSSANKYPAGNQAAGKDETLAQFSRPRFGPPYRPPMQRPMGGYPGMWSEPNWGRHAGIAALIGFGVGAGAGAIIGASKDNGVNRGGNALVGSLLLGGLGAAVGAAIASLPPFPSRQFHRHRPWEDEDYDELGYRPKPHSTNREAASHPARSRAPAKRQTALADIPAVP